MTAVAVRLKSLGPRIAAFRGDPTAITPSCTLAASAASAPAMDAVSVRLWRVPWRTGTGPGTIRSLRAADDAATAGQAAPVAASTAVHTKLTWGAGRGGRREARGGHKAECCGPRASARM